MCKIKCLVCNKYNTNEPNGHPTYQDCVAYHDSMITAERISKVINENDRCPFFYSSQDVTVQYEGTHYFVSYEQPKDGSDWYLTDMTPNPCTDVIDFDDDEDTYNTVSDMALAHVTVNPTVEGNILTIGLLKFELDFTLEKQIIKTDDMEYDVYFYTDRVEIYGVHDNYTDSNSTYIIPCNTSTLIQELQEVLKKHNATLSTYLTREGEHDEHDLGVSIMTNGVSVYTGTHDWNFSMNAEKVEGCQMKTYSVDISVNGASQITIQCSARNTYTMKQQIHAQYGNVKILNWRQYVGNG